MKESATPVNNVITRQLQREVLNCIQIQFMKESVTPVNNVFTGNYTREVLNCI